MLTAKLRATLSVAILCLLSPLAAQATPDVPALCAESFRQDILDGNARWLGAPPQLLVSGTSDEIFASIKDKSRRIFGGWILQDPLRLENSIAAWKIHSYLAKGTIDRVLPDRKPSVVQLLEEAAKQPAVYSPATVAHVDAALKELHSKEIEKGIVQMHELAVPLCAPFLDLGCPKAVRLIAKHMESRAWRGAYTSLPEVFARFWLDPGMVQGAAHFALKALRKAQLPSSSRPHAIGDFYTDLIESYLATGSTREQALNRAWTYLAIYGARGTSFIFYEGMTTPENLPLYVSFLTGTVLLGALDFATLPTGATYSYPTAVRTRCAYGVPYHFWLSAYLTHYLRQQGVHPRSAAVATHIAAKLYEFGSPTRDTVRIYKEKYPSRFGFALQKNVAFNDAGALWAAKMTANASQLSPDNAIPSLMRWSGPLPKMSPEQLEAGLKKLWVRFLWFHRLVAPDAYIWNFVDYDESKLIPKDQRR